MPGFKPGNPTLPILAADSLYLLQLDYCKEQRFVDSFRDAWQSIPATDRQPLLAYWQGWWERYSEAARLASPEFKAACASRVPEGLKLPEVPNIRVLGEPFARPGPYTIEVMGTELNYRADLADACPDDLLPHYAALPLAALFLRLQGEIVPSDLVCGAAFYQLDEWGLDSEDLCNWLEDALCQFESDE